MKKAYAAFILFSFLVLNCAMRCSTATVQSFLDHLNLKLLFAQNSINGNYLLSDQLVRNLTELNLEQNEIKIIVEAVASEISGFGTFAW